MGYLIIDHKAYDGTVVETDTDWCRHCQAVIDKRKWKADGGIWKCSGCDGPVCAACVSVRDSGNNLVCNPWKRQVDDAAEDMHRLEKWMGRSLSPAEMSELQQVIKNGGAFIRGGIVG